MKKKQIEAERIQPIDARCFQPRDAKLAKICPTVLKIGEMLKMLMVYKPKL